MSIKKDKATITYTGKNASINVQGIGILEKRKAVEVEIDSLTESIINSLKNDSNFKVEFPGKEPGVQEVREPLDEKQSSKEKQHKEKKKGGDK